MASVVRRTHHHLRQWQGEEVDVMIRFFHFLADDRPPEEERVMDEQNSCVWMDERDEDVGDPSWWRCSADAAAVMSHSSLMLLMSRHCHRR